MMARHKSTFGSASRPTIYGEGDAPPPSSKLRASKSTPNLSRGKADAGLVLGPSPAEGRAAAVDETARRVLQRTAGQGRVTLCLSVSRLKAAIEFRLCGPPELTHHAALRLLSSHF